MQLSPKRPPRKPVIDNRHITAKGIFETAVIATLDLYHEFLSLPDRNLITELNAIADQIRYLFCYKISQIRSDLFINTMIQEKTNLFKSILNAAVDFDELGNRIAADQAILFFETLQNNIRNSIFSYQHKLRLAENSFLNDIETKIKNERENSNLITNNDISALEKSLADHYTKINEIECKKNRAWNILNNEKPSKTFCLISRSRKKKCRS